MRQTIIILIPLLTTLHCFGQREHLEPARDLKQYDGILKEYYDNVFLLLYKGFTDKPCARYTAMPSFSREYAFSIERTGNKNNLISNSLSENYWYAKRRNKVKLETQKIEIGNNLYDEVEKLFQLLAEQTKISDKDGMGLDGVIYYFSTTDKNGEITTGETWSPKDNSLLNRLVEICDKLYSAGNGKNISESELVNKIGELITDMKK